MLSLVASSTAGRRPIVAPAQPSACNPALARLARARHVLLLQGPVGPFFDRLTDWLQRRGTQVRRVVFQRGDQHDCRAVDPIPFIGTLNEWPHALERLIEAHRIDALVLFGQARSHHACALAVARRLGVAAIVLEEGYLRPGFATMELGGVNGHSTTLDRFELVHPSGPAIGVPPLQAPGALSARMAGHAIGHYLSLGLRMPLNPHYVHHRSTELLVHGMHWLRTAWRWYRRRQADARTTERLKGEHYFFFPLQSQGDAQITQHSPFASVQASVTCVMESFARHAPAHALLVVREHPWSRGERDTADNVHGIARRLGIEQRVVHLQEGHTLTLVQHAAGVVVVNSTAGLLALRSGRPLLVLGDAVYRRPGLCSDEPMDRFWHRQSAPSPERVERFVRDLIGLTQVPCDLYAPRATGLDWRVPLVRTTP